MRIGLVAMALIALSYPALARDASAPLLVPVDPRSPAAAAPLDARATAPAPAPEDRSARAAPESRPSTRHPASNAALEAAITRHAAANGVPEQLVRRVILRESRYNARAVGRDGAMGLMQIKAATARSMGYTGAPAGLLDAETNLTYAVRYLAGAYRVSGGNQDRAFSNYRRGYYSSAKRRSPSVGR